ncbi:hypothetical protein PN498_00240 [Oscillatoria sp. CS-180]|uniref:hypothetical protein n=1 Tax=Oscillatoria sp. CS-180 TaxID=3021720 RepID=UPI0023309EFA|nr:hypothetical protein [Oscillatoria sp. CS-180]MDB9524399.1 hypothetical protein [Oscillatoria sp. CS-180]
MHFNRWITLGLVVAISSGCRSVPFNPFRSQPNIDNIELSLDVKADEQPGSYTLSGEVDLPDTTKLTVMAVRYLELEQSPLTVLEAKPTYSILDYEIVEIEDGDWETQLFLWRQSPDGEFKEAWQLQTDKLELAVEPEDEIFFLATLTPFDDLAAIERQLASENRGISNQLIQTTIEGRRYLQTGKALTIGLPEGETAPVVLREEEDINGGWGNRFLELPDLPNERQLDFPENRRTNAPSVSEEFLY